MKVLVLNAAGIGDFIESVPAIRALRAALPEARIDLLVSTRCLDYARRCPYTDNVWALPIDQGTGRWWLAPLRLSSLLVLIVRLRIAGYDWAVNLKELGSPRGAGRIRLLLRLVGSRATAGRDTAGWGGFYTKKVSEAGGEGLCQAQWFHKTAALIAEDLPALEPSEVWITEGERAQAARTLAHAAGDGPLIVLCPGADRETRRWLPASYAEAGKTLRAKLGARLVVAGPARDNDAAAMVLAQPDSLGAAPWTGSTVGGFAALLEKADLVICNNSLALHLAAAVKTPCVAISASGNPALDRPPVGEDRVRMLHKPLDCSPCYHWKCPRAEFMLCMERITPEEVVSAAESLLAE